MEYISIHRNIARKIACFCASVVMLTAGLSLGQTVVMAEWGTTVTVTEQIPGMDCGTGSTSGDGPDRRTYECTIEPGFGSVVLILKGLIKYATFITALVGVLMLVASGVQYSLAGASKQAADDAKKRIQKVLAGITLLFLIGFFLNTVAPWVYR